LVAAKELYDEHKGKAIDDFVDERMKSYYLKCPDIAINAMKFIRKSKELMEIEPTASLIYSSVATEVVLKSVLLKPVVIGLVHTESLAELVASTLVKQTGVDRFKKLVFEILETHIKFENGMANYSRDNSSSSLWEERRKTQEIRNQIMHIAIICNKDDAELSYLVAITFLGFTSLLIKNVGFKMDSSGNLTVM